MALASLWRVYGSPGSGRLSCRGSLQMSCIFSSAVCASDVQTQRVFFRRRFVIGAAIRAKSGMYSLIQLHTPKKCCNSFRFFGASASVILRRCSGRGEFTPCTTRCPRKGNCHLPNWHFSSAQDDRVVDVYLADNTDEYLQDHLSHESPKCAGGRFWGRKASPWIGRSHPLV